MSNKNFQYDGSKITFFRTSGQKTNEGWQLTDKGKIQTIAPFSAMDTLNSMLYNLQDMGKLLSVHKILVPETLAVTLFLQGIITPNHLATATEHLGFSAIGFTNSLKADGIYIDAIQTFRFSSNIVVMSRNVLPSAIAVSHNWSIIPHQLPPIEIP